MKFSERLHHPQRVKHGVSTWSPLPGVCSTEIKMFSPTNPWQPYSQHPEGGSLCHGSSCGWMDTQCPSVYTGDTTQPWRSEEGPWGHSAQWATQTQTRQRGVQDRGIQRQKENSGWWGSGKGREMAYGVGLVLAWSSVLEADREMQNSLRMHQCPPAQSCAIRMVSQKSPSAR